MTNYKTINFDTLNDVYDFIIVHKIIDTSILTCLVKERELYEANSGGGCFDTRDTQTKVIYVEKEVRVTYKEELLTIEDGNLNFYYESEALKLELDKREAKLAKEEDKRKEIISNEIKTYKFVGLLSLIPILYIIFGGYVFFNEFEDRFGQVAVVSIITAVISINKK